MNEISAQCFVPHDHPCLVGHFPGRPIVPGVVLLELVLGAIRSASTQPLKLEAIVSTKFLHAVVPETRLDIHIKFSHEGAARGMKARFVCSHATATVAEGSLLLMEEQMESSDGTL